MTKILANQSPKFWQINGQNFGHDKPMINGQKIGNSIRQIFGDQWPNFWSRQINGQIFGDQWPNFWSRQINGQIFGDQWPIFW